MSDTSILHFDVSGKYPKTAELLRLRKTSSAPPALLATDDPARRSRNQNPFGVDAGEMHVSSQSTFYHFATSSFCQKFAPIAFAKSGLAKSSHPIPPCRLCLVFQNKQRCSSQEVQPTFWKHKAQRTQGSRCKRFLRYELCLHCGKFALEDKP